MKLWKTWALALALVLTLTACGGSSAPQESQKGAVDVDLTQLSGTLVYAEVYNMASNPQDYVGINMVQHLRFHPE